MFPYDRRRSQTLLRSAIRDHMETSLYAYLKLVPKSSDFQINKIRHFYRKTSRSIQSIADIMMTADIIIYFVCKRQIIKGKKKKMFVKNLVPW